MEAKKGFRAYEPSYIHKTADIGNDTKIGAFCDIGKNVKIGEKCNIQAHVTISNDCKLGDRVFIGPNTSLLNDKQMDDRIQPVTVGDDAKIGGGVVVLPGIKIGVSAVIGAGSVVTKDVPPNTVVAGNHERIFRKRS